MRLNANQIEAAAGAVREVKDIDATIESLGNRVEGQGAGCGEAVQDIFGRNCLTQFTHNQLGRIVFCAVVNALLYKRQMCVNNHQDVVEFSDPPCPMQTTDLEGLC